MDKEEINSGRVLGLDVSTKTIGICLFDGDGKLLELTHITPKIKPLPETKLEELFKKVDAFERLLTRYIESQVYQGVVENIASEQAARMVAMKRQQTTQANLLTICS